MWIGVVGLVLAIVLVIGLFLSAFYGSETTKIITVDEKWAKYHGEDQKYLFSDTNGNVYSVEDSILLWKWDASDRYAQIEEDQTYRITTYWWRIHILSWYPNAIEIVNR